MANGTGLGFGRARRVLRCVAPRMSRTAARRMFSREDLAANDRIHGPAVIVESETATIVSSLFDAVMQSEGSILLVAKESRS